MPPKNKGKKGKKGGDDFWDTAGETVQINSFTSSVALDDVVDDDRGSMLSSQPKGYLASNSTIDEPEEVEEDFGGLMSTLKATAAKKGKKDQPVKKREEEFMGGECSMNLPSNSPDGLGEAILAEEADESRPKLLTKKEKEKLKKEREKAKKKAQAAAKKAEDADQSAETPSEPPPPLPSKEGDNDGTEGAKADAKKKKKKKGKKEEDAAPTPTPATASTSTTSKKKSGISALKAMMEEKKRLEEEAKRREEEERKRIEEEERRLEEEARKKEEERLRRKEKEKAKRELAKKEGRLLTKKQKEEKQMAEIRKRALLASGVQIEGLQQISGSGNTPGTVTPRKVVYGNRKKKPTAKDVSPAPDSRPITPVSADPPVSTALNPPAAEKDDWEATSDEEEVRVEAVDGKSSIPEGVKDSWDDSSAEEEEVQAEVAPAAEEAKSLPTKKPDLNGQTALVKTSAETPLPKVAEDSDVSASSSSTAESDDDSSSEEEGSSSDESTSSSSDEGLTQTQKMAQRRKAEAAERKAKAHEAALAARSKDNLRSPICCILGHVDTGKTKLLDKIRQTNVQEGEAGGITQQIGATYFPVEAIKTKTAVMNKDGAQEYKIPGLLIIDTPGHESFTNLRSRGSSLCNIAILVVDIMHGLEAQTLESLRLLRDRKTPFIVALNKIDRLYGWQATPNGAFCESLANQSRAVQREFEDRSSKVLVAFAEEGLNACLYYENTNFARNVSLVPTSAITGEGVPDMIMLLVNLTQQRMSDRLMYLSELECTVLEVKVIEGLGTTIDVVLSNGVLREGERIVVCGLNGPIVTQVRALLTPQPLKELRVKSAYVHHKEVKAALGVKIAGNDLEKAIAGSRLLVVGPDDDEDNLKEEVMSDLTSLLNSIDKSGRGVCVQASTLGSLEALLDFLKVSKIPVSGINIGPVHKKDVMRSATMLEKAKELACILCFDVPVDKEAERLAEEMGIRIFKADIIYHLFDAFKAYNEEIMEAKRRDAAPQAVWPCRLKTIAAFCKRDPIILGVDIIDGSLRIGTPLAVVKTDPATGKKDVIPLGKITSLEINHKSQEIVKKSQTGGGVAVKIEHAVYESAKMFGRHFDEKDEILSHISRQSIDVLKESFKADVSMEEWQLIKGLKSRFNIQ